MTIRARDAEWKPLCQYQHQFKNGSVTGRCGYSAWTHGRDILSASREHPFQYDIALDTSPEADRRALLAVAEAAAALLRGMDATGGFIEKRPEQDLRDALTALEATR